MDQSPPIFQFFNYILDLLALIRQGIKSLILAIPAVMGAAFGIDDPLLKGV